MHTLLAFHLAIGLYNALVLAGLVWLDHQDAFEGPRIKRIEAYVTMVLLIIMWEIFLPVGCIIRLRQKRVEEPKLLPPATITRSLHMN